MNETLQELTAGTLLFSLLLPSDLIARACPEDASSTQYLIQLQHRVARQDETAILTLAEHYLKGTCLPRDMAKGIALYETLARNDHPEAEFRLGLIYLNGYGVEKNFIIADEMFKRAIAHGHPQAKAFLEFLDDEGFDDC